MRRTCLLAGIILSLWTALPAIQAKEKEDKFEIAPQFSLLLDRDKNTDTRKYLTGVGAAFSYFPLKYIGLDAEYSFYAKTDFLQLYPGTYFYGTSPLQINYMETKANYNGPEHIALFGVKAGLRTKKFGLFVKARPGFAVFHPVYDCIPVADLFAPSAAINQCSENRLKNFAMDWGGVAEIYLPRHTFIRLDAGDTYLKFGKTTNFYSGSGIPGWYKAYGDDDRHHFQLKFGLGIGF